MDEFEQPYQYTGIRLTPRVFATLLMQLAPGQLIRRADAAVLVDVHHRDNGGIPAGRLDVVAKKALQTLEKAGAAEQAGAYGMWRIHGAADEAFVAPSTTGDGGAAAGSEYVYAYYLPVYEALARSRGDETWPHKIGMTIVSIEARVADQVGTALPERPIVAIAEETQDAALLERAIHAILELRGRKISDSPGNEWYDTNAAEIGEIVRFCIEEASLRNR